MINKNKIKLWEGQGHFYFFILLFISIVLRFLWISKRPFDGDEGVINFISGGSSNQLIERFTLDVHPPLHHILTWISFQILGINEFSARLVPALASIGILYIGYRLAKLLFNHKVAILSLIIMSLSPYLIFFAQENRMYSLFSFLILGSLWQWIVFIKNRNIVNGIFWTLWIVLALWTHHLAVAIFLFQIIFLVLNRKSLRYIIPYISLALVLYLPILSSSIGQFKGRIEESGGGADLIGNMVGIFNAFYRFVPNRIFLELDPSPSYYLNWLSQTPLQFIFFLLTLLLPLTLLAFGLYKVFREKGDLAKYLIYIIGYMIILGIMSSQVGPMASRYFSFLAPIIFIIVAYKLLDLKKNWNLVLLSSVLLILAWGLYSHYKTQQDAKGADVIAKYLVENAADGDLVVVDGAYLGGDKVVLEYYLQRYSDIPELNIYDTKENYRPGNYKDFAKEDMDIILNKKNRDFNVWYYDFTYSDKIDSKNSYNLGKDKEDKEIILYEFKK